MPRGFLVKRSKRTPPAIYRIREADREPPNTEAIPGGLTSRAPVACSDIQVSADVRESRTPNPAEKEQSSRSDQASESADNAKVFSIDYIDANTSDTELGSPGRADTSCSPIKPVGTEHRKSFFERCLSSPATAESFPVSQHVSSMERMVITHSSFPPSGMKYETPGSLYSPQYPTMKRSYFDSDRKGKPPAKKSKVNRKLSFEDEVTTSPVLGLKIKKESPESKASTTGRIKPLGEFICQLCKEEYPDPFSLAQHKCSRIVRVEYRCPECGKVFSCPANLASHRRWHKPRPVNNGESHIGKKSPSVLEQDTEKPSVEGKENASKMLINDQHHTSLDSSMCPVQQHRNADGIHGPDEQHKKLQGTPAPEDHHYKSTEKYFDLHHRAGESPRLLGCPETTDATTAPYSHSPGPGEEVYECRYCSKTFRRQAYLRKHLVSHETIRTTSYNQIESGPITCPCHLCGAHFPSAEIRDKHRLWHAVREDMLVSPGKSANTFVRANIMEGEQQIFPCKHCPSTFFSSPGLTRHINKSHPTENRQVMLLQMPVRPGC